MINECVCMPAIDNTLASRDTEITRMQADASKRYHNCDTSSIRNCNIPSSPPFWALTSDHAGTMREPSRGSETKSDDALLDNVNV